MYSTKNRLRSEKYWFVGALLSFINKPSTNPRVFSKQQQANHKASKYLRVMAYTMAKLNKAAFKLQMASSGKCLQNAVLIKLVNMIKRKFSYL